MDNSFEKPPIEEPGKLPEEEKKEELTPVEKPAIEEPDLETKRQQEIDAYWDAVLKQIPSEYKEAEKQRQEERNQQLKDEYDASRKVIDKYESLPEKEFHKWIDTQEYRDLFEIMDRGMMKPMGQLFKNGEFSVKGKDWLLSYYESSLAETPIGINAKYDAEKEHEQQPTTEEVKPAAQIGEKVSATASEKRVLGIKTENAFTIPIIREGEQVGASTIENLPEGWRIKWIDVEGTRTTPTARGAGREAMRLLNQEAAKEGKVLISDLEGKNQPDMIKAWKKLVESGEAEQLPDGSWAFKKVEAVS